MTNSRNPQHPHYQSAKQSQRETWLEEMKRQAEAEAQRKPTQGKRVLHSI